MPRLLAFTDPHGDLKAVQAVRKLAAVKKPDVIVCAGDLTFFGQRHTHFFKVLADIGKPIYFIPGNHEDAKTTAGIVKAWPFMIDVSFKLTQASGFTLLGVPGNDLAFWPGRSKGEEDVVRTVQQLVEVQNGKGRLVFLAHYPPSGCEKVDASSEATPDRGGSSAVRSIVEKIKPTLVVSGHYHSCFNCEDRVDGTRILNPGPNGKIIEIEV